jgi:hypothetical protein
VPEYSSSELFTIGTVEPPHQNATMVESEKEPDCQLKGKHRYFD